jgi:hypothetical protein
VRGYGLKDSERGQRGARRENVKLQVANQPPLRRKRRRIYPASYWTVDDSAAADERASGQVQESGRMAGRPEERVQPSAMRSACRRPRIYTTAKDWDAMFLRAQSMHRELDAMGKPVVEKMLADWGARVAAGEVPPAPPRPTGIERNVVISQWDWGSPESFVHDLISTGQAQPDAVLVRESLRSGPHRRR